MKSRSGNNFLLALTALIWGSAFVAQSVGMDYLGPFTFNSVRCFLGGLVLIPVILVMRRRKREMPSGVPGEAEAAGVTGRRKTAPESAAHPAGTGSGNRNGSGSRNRNRGRKTLLAGGICCGLALAVGSSLQQIGLMYTDAGTAGFITALYILIVPLIRAAFGKRAGAKVWIGVALAVVGMYFLCIGDGVTSSKGNLYVLLCAVAFSVHILVIDHFAPKTDGVAMSCIQFFVCGILCAVPMLVSEHPLPAQVLNAWLPLTYAGVLSCGVGYTLQVVAQKNTDPTVASLLLSLESVFSVIAGWIILGERMSGRQLFGCALMFAAIILAQLPSADEAP